MSADEGLSCRDGSIPPAVGAGHLIPDPVVASQEVCFASLRGGPFRPDMNEHARIVNSAEGIPFHSRP